MWNECKFWPWIHIAHLSNSPKFWIQTHDFYCHGILSFISRWAKASMGKWDYEVLPFYHSTCFHKISPNVDDEYTCWVIICLLLPPLVMRLSPQLKFLIIYCSTAGATMLAGGFPSYPTTTSPLNRAFSSTSPPAPMEMYSQESIQYFAANNAATSPATPGSFATLGFGRVSLEMCKFHNQYK